MSTQAPKGDRATAGDELAELARINAQLRAEIEQRRRAEAVLRQSEERFAKAFRSSPDALAISRVSDGLLMDVNHSWEQLIGYEAAEVLGKDRQTLQLAPDEALRDRLIQRLASDGSYREEDLRLRQRSGAIRDMRVSAETFEIGGEQCAIGRLRDITEQKEAERALQASDQRLHMALAAAKMAIWEWLIPENRLIWSEEVASIFALADGETIDTPNAILAHVHPEDRILIQGHIAEITLKPTQAQESYDTEFRILWPTGETRWVASKGLIFFAAAGVPIRGVGTLIDMTERKEAEERAQRYLTGLWRMARIKTADQMASSLAHELNQPLTAIAIQTGVASSLVSSDNQSASPDLKVALKEIGEQAKRAGGIIRSLRDLIKKGDSRRALVSLNDIVREVVALIETPTRQHHVGVSLQLSELPSVSADRVQIAQILMNLFQNAIDAMQERAVGERQLEVVTTFVDRAVLLSVRDTGTGIPAEIGNAVFDSFYTTKTEGIGVGLAICRSIAEAHGAKLWFTSTPGVGTTFYLRLPVAAAEELP